MPASFIADICGYRATNGSPNTSDSTDSLSVALGRALFAEMGVPDDHIVATEPGDIFEASIADHLQSVRSDLMIRRSRPADSFDQYAHLAVFRRFWEDFSESGSLDDISDLALQLPDSDQKARLLGAIGDKSTRLTERDTLISLLRQNMPRESLLKIDVSAAEASPETTPPLLHIALSFKWSLRTDRAQDCVSQGTKLVAQRRGRMPHFAVVTMEPRPAMLKILGDGSGSIDCVYHPDLPALKASMKQIAASKSDNWSPKRTFERLLGQGRLRDYDDLVHEIQRLPGPQFEVPAPVPQGKNS